MVNSYDSIYSREWGRTRCAIGKALRNRVLIYNNDSPCTSPFSKPEDLNIIDYLPISYYKLYDTSAQIEDNRADIDLITDVNQDISYTLSTENLLVILDISSKQIVCTGKIRSYEQFSNTDVSVKINLIRNQYRFSDLFNMG